MSARPKRSERLKIALTPKELEQLKRAAEEANRPLATYAHGLLCQGLHRGTQAQMEDTFETAEWVSLMGELYGLLDVVAQHLSEESPTEQPELAQPNLESLLNEVKAGIKDIRQTLALLPQPGEASSR